MSGWVFSNVRCGAVIAAAALILFAPSQVAAQVRNLTAPQSTTTVPGTLGTGLPGATIVAPAPLASPVPPAPPPMTQAAPLVPAGHVALAVAARYGRDTPLISSGL